MVRCSFSGKEIPQGTGKMFVKKDGTVLWFASSKAEKNMLKLGRKANKTRWTEEGRESKRAVLAALKHEEEAEKEESSTDSKKETSSKKSTKGSKSSENKGPSAKSKSSSASKSSKSTSKGKTSKK